MRQRTGGTRGGSGDGTKQLQKRAGPTQEKKKTLVEKCASPIPVFQQNVSLESKGR